MYLRHGVKKLTHSGDIVKQKMRRHRGFSLIELLIVVAIILIIAAIAIPNLLRSRISANESSAASSIRTVSTAEVSYTSAYPTQGYAANATAMANLGPGAITGCPAGGPLVTAACLIDWNLSQATTIANSKSGYYFGITSTSAAAPYTQYTVSGAASGFNQTGVRGFCSNEDAAIHFNPSYNGAPTIINTVCASAVWPQLQ
jgi:type IV pilus assembly protein PilA